MASTSGKNIFALFFSINLTLLILLVPAFSASAITYEKENRTYASLFTTLLTPSEILLGKLFASISVLVFLVLFSLPIASVCALTGGISIIFMCKVTSIILVAAFSYGLLGLACSSIASKTSTAIIVNYSFIMIFAGVSWLPSVLLSDLIGFKGILQAIRSISPYDALFYLIYPETYSMSVNSLAVPGGLSPYALFMIFSFIISILSFLVFSKNILRPSSKKAKSQELYTESRKAVKRKLTWPFYLIDPLKRKKNIKRWANPVFVAELRSKLFANPQVVARIISVIFILSLVILFLVANQFAVNFSANTVNLVAIVFQIGVVAMLAPSVSSGLITDEIAAGTLTALRMTPISPVKMVVGKLKATFFYASIFILSSFFVILAMAYLIQQNIFPSEGSVLAAGWWSELAKMMQQPGWYSEFWRTYWRLIIWIVILLLSTVTFLSGGLFASSVSKKTGVATAISYSIVAIICLVSFAPVVLGDKISHSLSILILSLNPIASAMQIMSGTAFHDYPGLWKYNIIALFALSSLFICGAAIRLWYLFNNQD